MSAHELLADWTIACSPHCNADGACYPVARGGRSGRKPGAPLILVDANLLLYAYHPRAREHGAARRWLENALAGPELVRFALLTLWAFLRLSTNSRVFLQELMRTGQATGPLVTDAAIAALAIEHGAVLQTTDRDFARFAALKWRNPLE